MRLIRLQLKNFRQHADTELIFRPGQTGINGPNGAGKTTLLEALAWAIYGAAAVRGTNETLRFNRAPGRSSVRVELEFALEGERYRVVRTPRGAELYQAGRDDPVAAGVSEVTRQLTRRLGMTRQEFFNTYFTGQKELQFLAAMVQSGRRASELSRSFDTVPQLLKNVRFAVGATPLEADAVKAAIAAAEGRLAGQGRLLIRKSGTEPLIRVMAECEDESLLGQVVDEVVAAVEAAA